MRSSLDFRRRAYDPSPDCVPRFHLPSVAAEGTRQILAGCAPDQASASLGSR